MVAELINIERNHRSALFAESKTPKKTRIVNAENFIMTNSLRQGAKMLK